MKHFKKIYFLGFLLLPLFLANKVSALTVESKWLDAAHIEITKFEIQESDLNDEMIEIMNNELGGGPGAFQLIKDKAAQNIVGVYYDDNVTDGEPRWVKNTGCSGEGQRTAITDDSGQLVIDSNNLYLNFEQIDCKKILKFGVDINPADSFRSNIYFVASEDGTTVTRVDGGGGQPPYKQTPGNPLKYFSEKSGDCDVAVTLDEELKSGDELTPASWQDCTGNPRPIQVSSKVIDGGGGSSSNGGTTAEATCEANNAAALAWLFCGMIDVIDKGVTGLSDAAVELLDTNPAYYSNESLKEVWSYFKNLASFLLIIVGLVMIIGQAVTKE